MALFATLFCCGANLTIICHSIELSFSTSDGVLSQEIMKQMIESSNQKKDQRLKAEREPKIGHVLENSQESKMVASPTHLQIGTLQ